MLRRGRGRDGDGDGALNSRHGFVLHGAKDERAEGRRTTGERKAAVWRVILRISKAWERKSWATAAAEEACVGEGVGDSGAAGRGGGRSVTHTVVSWDGRLRNLEKSPNFLGLIFLGSRLLL